MEVSMKYFYVALVVILLAVACTKKQTVKGEGSVGETIFEEVSPEEVDTSSIVFEEVPVTPPSGSFIEEPLEEKPVVVSSTPSVTRRGYRVQIGAYGSQAEANATADRARSLLTKSVYIQYIAPYYKVRVGNFINKYEATQYKNQLRNTSYRDAWVVESEIIAE
jgi:cell division septation protein DedD